MTGLNKFLLVVIFLQILGIVHTMTEYRSHLEIEYDKYVIGLCTTIPDLPSTWIGLRLSWALMPQLLLLTGTVFTLERHNSIRSEA